MVMRYSSFLEDSDKRKILITGGMLPFVIRVMETRKMTFEIISNYNIDKSHILNESRKEEIYFTLWGTIQGINGLVQATIPSGQDFFISFRDYTCKYDSSKQSFKIVSWKNGKRNDEEYRGKIKKVFLSDNVKIKFEDRTETFV